MSQVLLWTSGLFAALLSQVWFAWPFLKTQEAHLRSLHWMDFSQRLWSFLVQPSRGRLQFNMDLFLPLVVFCLPLLLALLRARRPPVGLITLTELFAKDARPWRRPTYELCGSAGRSTENNISKKRIFNAIFTSAMYLCVCVCFAELHTNHLADSHQTFWRCIAWAKKEPYIFGGKQFSFYIGFVGGLCSLSVCWLVISCQMYPSVWLTVHM